MNEENQNSVPGMPGNVVQPNQQPAAANTETANPLNPESSADFQQSVVTPTSSPANTDFTAPTPAPVVAGSFDSPSPSRKKPLILIGAVIVLLAAGGTAFALLSSKGGENQLAQDSAIDTPASSSGQDPVPTATFTNDSPENAIKQFVDGIQKKDQPSVETVTGDSLLALTRQSTSQPKLTFYEACQDDTKYQLFCTETFQAFDANQKPTLVEDKALADGKPAKKVRFAKQAGDSTNGAKSYYEFQVSQYPDGWKIELYKLGFDTSSSGQTRIQDPAQSPN